VDLTGKWVGSLSVAAKMYLTTGPRVNLRPPHYNFRWLLNKDPGLQHRLSIRDGLSA
jgi:hypothetical protein